MERATENIPPQDDESMLESYLLALKSVPAATPARPLSEPKAMMPSLPAALFNSQGSLPSPGHAFALNYALAPFAMAPVSPPTRSALDKAPFPIDTRLTPVDSPTIDSPIELPPLPALYNVYGGTGAPAYANMFPFNGAVLPYMPLYAPPAAAPFPNPLPTSVPRRPDVAPARPAPPPKPATEGASATKMTKEMSKAIIFVQDKDGDNAKPFRCPVEGCQRTYKYKGDLKTHVQNVHSDMPELPDIISPPKKSKEGKRFPCPIEECPSGFKSKRDLGRHLRHKHPNFNSLEKDFIHYWKKEDEA